MVVVLFVAGCTHPTQVSTVVTSVSSTPASVVTTATSELPAVSVTTTTSGREEQVVCRSESPLARNYLDRVPDASWQPISYASYMADRVSVEEFLTGGSVDQGDLDQALIYAAIAGCVDIVQALLDSGANPRASGVGLPAVYAATLSGNAEVVGTLIEAGADIDALWGPEDWQPIHEAAAREHVEVLRVLLEAGADPNATSTLGETPAQWASLKDCAECLRVLFEYGAEPETRALTSAVANGASLPTLRVLLDAGADPTALDPLRGASAIDLAHSMGRSDVVDLLDEYTR